MEKFAQIFATLLLVGCAAAASTQKQSAGVLGVVTNTTRCGGFGTPLELRVSDCEGQCELYPGRLYTIEWDLMPSQAAPSLSIACDLVFQGTPLRLFESVIPNSGVQPGYRYTLTYQVVPNDVLSGQLVLLRGILLHTDTRLLELCVQTQVYIHQL